jgi:hypothetical protein
MKNTKNTNGVGVVGLGFGLLQALLAVLVIVPAVLVVGLYAVVIGAVVLGIWLLFKVFGL